MPVLLKPFLWLYGYCFAILIYAVFLMVHATVRIEYRNREVLKSRQNHIFSMWHENLLGHFVVFTRYDRDFVWLNHPFWFMKPIHIILYWMGTKKLMLGSSGNSGKKALAEVIAALKQGSSTMINPDGPQGPTRKIKDGVLNMSIETGIPVIPLKITSPTALTVPTWDKKRFPIPFSKVIVEYGEPILVTGDNMEASRKLLHESM
ncbi:MAG: DUF374 domain-containing protein [Flavobacteriales bacterium]|nr:DUF374 domain-containing protein [Flavobacteriales bacterium]